MLKVMIILKSNIQIIIHGILKIKNVINCIE